MNVNNEILKKSLRGIKYVGEVVILLDTLHHGYRLYKEYVAPRIKRGKGSTDEPVNDQQ